MFSMEFLISDPMKKWNNYVIYTLVWMHIPVRVQGRSQEKGRRVQICAYKTSH
jgi:hypothetical protein